MKAVEDFQREDPGFALTVLKAEEGSVLARYRERLGYLGVTDNGDRTGWKWETGNRREILGGLSSGPQQGKEAGQRAATGQSRAHAGRALLHALQRITSGGDSVNDTIRDECHGPTAHLPR